MEANFRKLGFSERKLRVHLFFGMIVVAAITLCGVPSANATPRLLSGSVTNDLGQPLSKDSILKFADVNGQEMQLTLASIGTYKVDTSTLQAPILIQAGDIYSYSLTGSGVANVTPLTDLIVNQIYQAYDTNASTQFPLPAPRQITPIQLQATWSLTRDVFQQPSAFYKIPATFNPFTTKFSSTSGFGKLLSHTTFTGFGAATQTVQSPLGTIDFTATFNADSGAHWSTSVWQSQLPSSGPYSLSGGYSIIPSDPNAGATYGGVADFFKTRFLPILRHEGTLLDYFNLASLYAPGYLNSGRDAITQSKFDATDWRAIQFTGIKLGVIRDYQPNFPDALHNRINLAVDYMESLHGGTLTKRHYQDFICNTDGTGCLYYGDQQLGGTSSDIRFESNSLSAGIPTTLQQLRVKLSSPAGQFASVTVSDALNSYYNMTPMPRTMKTITLKPLHNGPTEPYSKDEYSLKTTLSAPFVYNNEFSYFADSFTYDSYVYGFTFEPVNWMAPDVNRSHLLSDFKLGTPIAVKFAPPLTFIPLRVKLEGTACNGTQSIDLSSLQKFISPMAKSASIIVPKQVMGLNTTGFELRLRYEGLYGQNSFFKYGVGAACF